MEGHCCTQNEPYPKQKATLFLSCWKQNMTLLSQLNQDQNLVGFNDRFLTRLWSCNGSNWMDMASSCKLKTRFGSTYRC